MKQDESFTRESFFTPDWHHSLSPFLGDLKGEVGYVTEYGMIHLISDRDIDLSKFAVQSKINGPVKSITANKSKALI